MQDSPRPLYARASALGAAALLAVSGAFIAGPAMANTGDSPKPATTEAPATAPVDTEASAPAESGDATLAPGLKEALQRDLNMTVEEFLAAGELGKKASDALAQLKATEGFVSIEVLDGGLVITGSGEELRKLATELEATVVEPAAPVAAPLELLTTAPETNEAKAPETTPAEVTETTPAADEETKATAEAKQASDLRGLLKEYAAATGSADKLHSVSGNAAEGFVLKVAAPAQALDAPMAARSTAARMTPQEFDALYSNVTVSFDHSTAMKLQDIANGSGYIFESGADLAACSIGFSAHNAAGDDAVITAGHCPEGSTSPATVLEHYDYALGLFGAYTFNGTEENPSTDIAVIDNINPELDLLPETLQWKSADDLSATTVNVTGSTSPVEGAPVCKSGRTSFWSCGTITESDVLVNVDGGTWVESFGADLEAAQGDSGGSMISGNLAVGVISSGVPGSGIVYGADLDRAMAQIPGYSIAIHLDAPKLTSPENKGTVETDAAITGTAPAGSTVNVTIDGDDVKADTAADGTWTVKAPTLVPEDKNIDITAQAVNGFNKSKVSKFELDVKEAPLPAPTFTTPGSVIRSLGMLEGTGVAGATVSLTIDPVMDTLAEDPLTAKVGEDGKWSVELAEPLGYGNYVATAKQGGIEGKEASAATTLKLAVAPSAPVITSPTDGSEFMEGKLPRDITGTATPGLEVVVSFGNTEPMAVEVDEDGNWTYEMPDLKAGSVAISAMQLANGVFSEAAVTNVTVTAPPAPVEPPVTVNPVPAGNPGQGGTGAGDLPDTGASNIGLLAGGGATLLVAGAGALIYSKRRRASVDA